MEIREIKEKNIWEDFLCGCEEKTFLNSWQWGEFNKNISHKIWRFGVYGEKLECVALIIKIKARRGTFLFCPHGPVIKSAIQSEKLKVLKILLNELKNIAKTEGVSFIKISPLWPRNQENLEMFKRMGFMTAPLHINPELTWELDIRSPEEELLKNMRKTTRYLIRQGIKNKEINIIKSCDSEKAKSFNELYKEVALRHHFTPFSLDYLKNEINAFKDDDNILVFSGLYKGELVAAAIIVFWQKRAFYHHGASSMKYAKIPITYLLQWEAIKEAKKRGCQYYNFWGLAPANKPNHPWAGLTLFKKGFSGQEKEYIKTQDLPLNFYYWQNYLIEKIRKIKRRL